MFEELGVGIVAVSMSKPELLGPYLQRRPLPFPIYADPDRASYQAMGLPRSTWWRFLRPAVIGKYLALIFRGWRIRRIPEGEDALQLGGDFLIARSRRLLWEYRSASPTDRPDLATLLAAARKVVDDQAPRD